SRSIESLVKEARVLVKSGVQEIILVSQDSTYYGLDTYKRMALSELLEQLHEIEDLKWIRVMYCYPTETNDQFLRTMARLPKVVKYVDIPLQHSHPDMLTAMARPLNPERVVYRIREMVPDVRIRSTFIVGFPGETDEHFSHLQQFIERHEFDRLGVFTYSRQMEVPSGHMENQVAERIKKERRKRIMQTQHEIALRKNQELVGKEIDVLVESYDDRKELFIGRSQWDAPQIDNQVYVRDEANDPSLLGTLVRVRIDQARPYDLYGTAIGQADCDSLDRDVTLIKN
ncbi:MAG TPA: radical SAM protein, partial [Candidatus Obscuribacterales bacterium]